MTELLVGIMIIVPRNGSISKNRNFRKHVVRYADLVYCLKKETALSYSDGVEPENRTCFSRLDQRGPLTFVLEDRLLSSLRARNSPYASVLAVHPFSLLWAASMEQ